jgi:hypothetical protein
MSKPFRQFKAKRETKKQFVERVHPQVEGAESLGHLWRLYYVERFEKRTDTPFTPEMVEILRGAFYSGAASMFQLMLKLSGPQDEPDEVGAARITRLHEELDTYARGLK